MKTHFVSFWCQKVSECMKQSATLLGRRMSNDAVCALAVIADALMLSPCSEKLLEMKADGLLMVCVPVELDCKANKFC